METGKITARQFSFLVFLAAIGSSILFIPSYVSAAAKQDSWLAILFAIMFNQLFIGIYVILSRMIPGKNLYDMILQLLGKVLGTFTIICLFLFAFLVGVASVLFDVGFFLSTQLFSNTPVFLLNAMFIFIIVMALRLGLVTIARTSELLLPVFLFLFLLLVVSVSPEIKLGFLKPALQANAKDLIKGVVHFTSFTTFPLILILLVFPTQVLDERKAARGFLLGSLFSGIVLLVMTLTNITVLGPVITPRNTFPSYVLAQRINIGGFFTRIEVVMAALWMISLYFKLLMYFYASVQALARLTYVSSAKIFTIPLGIAAAVLATGLHSDTVEFYEFNKITWPVISIVFGVILPVFLLILAVIRKWRKKGNT